MPPHKIYVEACMGSAEVFLRKKPVEREIINDYNGDLVKFFRVLQQNEKLAYLLGRLYLSFNSEELFRINKAMLADVPKATPHKLQSFRLAEVYQHILWITSAVLPAKAH